MAAGKGRPTLHTIAAHRAFADALVAGLMAGRDQAALARGLVLLPNNRAVRAITDAFVRASGGGLILPRLVALGDPELGEAVGSAIDLVDGEGADEQPPPAVAPYARRMILARLVSEERARAGQPVSASEAVRLAGELARTLDQLLVEEVAPARLAALDLGPELTEHWNRALATFAVVLDRWPAELARLGAINAAARRALLIGQLERRWRAVPPTGFVVAAGVTDPAPAVARLLRCVAEMPSGRVVFAGLDLAMPEEEWEALGPHRRDSDTGATRRSIETHPQFHLKLLLDRMGVARDEVTRWRGGAASASLGADADAARGRAIANALAPADFTGKWTDLAAGDRRLAGVTAAEFATPAEEAQGIALALRGALEEPGRTVALVTPDRALARRVVAHLARWNIYANDSAGQPLSLLPPGVLLLLLAEAAAQRFAPLALLALLKHPLVRNDDRLPWLDGVRALDRALRGPRPPAGLAGIATGLKGRAAAFWEATAPLLEPLCRTVEAGPQPLAGLLACLREAADSLCGEALWAGPAGRQAAEFLAAMEAAADAGPTPVDPAELPAVLRTLLDEISVRLQQNRHPRLAIYGLIEARLQSADLMVLGGLNEGVWPGRPAPDPWLAPRIRQALGLQGLERRIGVAAHDFVQGLGAPRVIVTRARRDASAPALASRLWLRLQAMAGDRFERDRALEAWTRSLDAAADFAPAARPAPRPAAALRPKAISVTEVDRLKADPYAFYARRVLGLSPLDPVDADPSAAWRGTAVHDILEAWWVEDGCAPDALRPRAMRLLAEAEVHPLLRALWQPRLREAIDWIAAEVTAMAAAGRRVLAAEGRGTIDIAGVRLTGRYDRIDRLTEAGPGAALGGALAVIDYKTGKPPSAAAVRGGFSLQLGLLGLIAERGGFEGIEGRAAAFEYWSLAKRREAFGYIDSPCDPDGKRDRIVTDDFVAIAARNFADAAAQWLTGDAPFTAKLVPEHAPFAEYDQLMRRDEWYGRDR